MQRPHKSNSISRSSATPHVPGEHCRFCARDEQRACAYVTGSRMCCSRLLRRRSAALSQRTGKPRKGRPRRATRDAGRPGQARVVSPLQACAAGLSCPRVSVLGEPQRNGNALSMPPGRHDHTCPRAFPYPYGTVEGPGDRDGQGHVGSEPRPAGPRRAEGLAPLQVARLRGGRPCLARAVHDLGVDTE
jgi:hypothetical protein